MSHLFGLTIESLVAVLLLLTILYCARLNSRLKMLKADERAMKTTIAELVLATENAERAIGGLNATLREAEETLSVQLRNADIFNLAMAENLQGRRGGARPAAQDRLCRHDPRSRRRDQSLSRHRGPLRSRSAEPARHRHLVDGRGRASLRRNARPAACGASPHDASAA